MIDGYDVYAAAREEYRKKIAEQAAEIDRLRAENFSLAAWQCEFTDGKTGLVAHEHGGTYCAMAKENERLRAVFSDFLGILDDRNEQLYNLRIEIERLRSVLHDINMTTRCDKTAVKARSALKPAKD